jgi:hypothetical protein
MPSHAPMPGIDCRRDHPCAGKRWLKHSRAIWGYTGEDSIIVLMAFDDTASVVLVGPVRLRCGPEKSRLGMHTYWRNVAEAQSGRSIKTCDSIPDSEQSKDMQVSRVGYYQSRSG